MILCVTVPQILLFSLSFCLSWMNALKEDTKGGVSSSTGTLTDDKFPLRNEKKIMIKK